MSSALEEFLKKAVNTHGDLYDYSEVVYVNSKTKVKILCDEHGAFMQAPAAHVRGDKCWKCGVEERSFGRRVSVDILKEELSTIHSGKYAYIIPTDYCNNKSKIKILCSEHGWFEQSINSHKRGRGCPSCSRSGFDPNKPAILYYLKVERYGQVVYKIGITNLTVAERFGGDMQYITVLDVWEYAIGEDAYRAEQKILSDFKCDKYTGMPLLCSGNSELFNSDIRGENGFERRV